MSRVQRRQWGAMPNSLSRAKIAVVRNRIGACRFPASHPARASIEGTERIGAESEGKTECKIKNRRLAGARNQNDSMFPTSVTPSTSYALGNALIRKHETRSYSGNPRRICDPQTAHGQAVRSHGARSGGLAPWGDPRAARSRPSVWPAVEGGWALRAGT